MMGKTACTGLLLTILLLGVCDRSHAQAARQFPVTVVINEVLASNRSILRDPQWQYEDWIELCNTGRVAVDVGGCYLTDDLSRPTKWQIPAGNPAATTIPPGGYLLIWADGDVGDPGLHAGFRLSDEGEEVGLFAVDGVKLIDSLSFGPQYTDVSYGRYPDGGPDLWLLTVPTPGGANIVVHEGVASPPQFDVKSRVCAGPITVTLTTATEGAVIHYTTDGSDPFSVARERPVGTTYAAPFVVSRTTTVKAIAWRPGWRHSDIRTERYVFLNWDVLGFSSNLPLIVLDQSDGRIAPGDRSGANLSLIDCEPDGRARLSGPVSVNSRVLANVRGSSSQQFPKKMFGIHLVDEEGRSRKESLLGMPEEHNWILYAPYSDKSLMRNTVAYGMSNDIGRYAPRTRFVELFLHEGNGPLTQSHYHGVYVLVERIKWAPGRVDIAKLSPADESEPEISGGYILKKDRLNPGDQGLLTARGTHLAHVRPNEQEITATQRQWLSEYLNRFESTLFGPGFATPETGYAAFIDAGSFIDFHLITELCKEIDGYRLSTFMHKDRGGKLTMGPLWDFNLSLGNANYLEGWRPQGWYYPLISQSQYLHGWYTRLFQDPEFRMQYADRWFALRREAFATDRLMGIIDGYAALLNESQARNFVRWPVLGSSVWPNWFVAQTHAQEIDWMKGWLAERLAWMDSQIAVEFAPAPPLFNRQGGHVESGFSLTVGGPGTIYYTTDGSDPRLILEPAALTSGTMLVPENASKRVLVPTGPVEDAWRSSGAFNDSAWTLATGGVGFERSTGYENFFSLDVGPQMYGRLTSCYIRIPFHISGSPRIWSTGTLRVRYDDGFVAYLNGVEIARRNFTGNPAWNSAAGSQHDDLDAVNFEGIEIADIGTILRRADNLLAIHAMNASTGSSDFLIAAELTVSETAQSPTPSQVHRYAGPVPLTESARIVARSLNAGRWSAVNDVVFAVGPVAESVRISEILYHPPDPNAEFIELMNIGGAAVNLNLARFTDGIQFTFPSFSLPPLGYCLVVRNLAVFEATYGPGLPVAGQYAGRLDNAGERIELRDAAGRIIHRFTYRDDWYDSTDGDGFSLVVADPRAVDPNALGDRAAWRPSRSPGGSLALRIDRCPASITTAWIPAVQQKPRPIHLRRPACSMETPNTHSVAAFC